MKLGSYEVKKLSLASLVRSYDDSKHSDVDGEIYSRSKQKL